MKRSGMFIAVLLIAFVAFAGLASAQEASVFDEVQKLLIRVHLTPTGESPTTYSAFLKVWDSDGGDVAANQLTVKYLSPTGDQTLQAEADGTYKLHNNDLTSSDFSLSFDNQDGITYLVCTDTGLHVMKYSITTSLPVTGTCGSSNGGTFTSAPSTELCAAGSTAGTVSGTGPWNWTCTGANGGTRVDCSANIQRWTVTPSASTGGSISPSVQQTVNHGSTAQFTITPNSGYSATVGGTCGGSPASGTSVFTYTTNAVTSNCTVAATFTQNSGSGADLYPSYFKMPGAGENNRAFSGYATVANIGTGAAGPFNVKIYMGGQLLTNGTQRVTSLGAGSSVTVNFSNLKFSSLALHTYYKIKVVVDADSEVAETNETNNEKTRDFEVL